MKEKSTLKDVANNYLTHTKNKKGITLIAFAISRKCVRYEERA